MVITVDTMILIWGVRGFSMPHDADMIPKAQALLEWIDRQGHQLSLTSVAVSEYLIGDEEEVRDAEFTALVSKFIILPFDSKAARIASAVRSDKDFLNSLKEQTGKTRNAISADIQIAATALAHGVDRIHTHDKGLHAIAARCGLSHADLLDPSALEPTPKLTGKPPHESQPGLFTAGEEE